MADPDYTFQEGYDHYWPCMESGQLVDLAASVLPEYYVVAGGVGTCSTQPPLSGSTGSCMQFIWNANTTLGSVLMPTGVNLARCLGGYTFQADYTTQGWATNNCSGVQFADSATNQLFIGLNPSGNIIVRRGSGVGGTLLATSVETVLNNAIVVIEYDVTFHGSAGIVKVWLNGVATSISLTGQNTAPSGNNQYNRHGAAGSGQTGGAISAVARYDHYYNFGYLASGGTETPLLTLPIIESQFETSDSSAVFSVGAGVLGDSGAPAYINTSSNAPGAGQLALRKFTPAVNCTLASVGILPKATSAAAKLKAVLYADSAGSPGSLTATGTEVVGTTNGTRLTLPFAAGQTLTGGTSYWIGYITDTSVVIQQYDGTTNLGQKKANTYASGAPNPAGAMTAGQPSWLIWGNLSAVSAKWPQEAIQYASTMAYNFSATVGDKDLFAFPALVAAASAIHLVSLVSAISKSDAGARTINLLTKSGATESSGSLGTYSPPLSLTYARSDWLKDPNTGSAWANAAAVNAALGGYKIAA